MGFQNEIERVLIFWAPPTMPYSVAPKGVTIGVSPGPTHEQLLQIDLA